MRNMNLTPFIKNTINKIKSLSIYYYAKIKLDVKKIHSNIPYQEIKDKFSLALKTNNNIFLYQSSKNYELFNPHLIKGLSVVFISILFAFLIIASVTHIKEAVIAQGEIQPEGSIVTLQHFDGGVVTKINVNEGEIVKKGDVLLEIDGIGAKEDLAKAISENLSLKLREERLRSVLNETKPNFEKYMKDDNLIEEQVKIYKEMLQAAATDKAVITNQIKQQEESLNALISKKDFYDHEVIVANAVLDMYKKLNQANNTSKLQLLQTERDLITLSRERNAVEYEIKKTEQALQEYKNRLLSYDATQKNTLNKEHEKIAEDIKESEETINKLNQKAKRVDFRAPVSGITKASYVHSVGESVYPGKNLFEIVPFEKPLIATLNITPADVGNLKLGETVRIKVSAFDYIKYGVITGTLYQISADTFQNDKNETYYKGKVRLNKNYFTTNGNKKYLMPGMLIKAEIETGDRTIMEYLLKPIYRSLEGGLVEH